MRTKSATISLLLASVLATLTLLSAGVGGHSDPGHGHDDDATWPGEPYYAEMDFFGLIGCAAGARPLNPADLCRSQDVQGMHTPTLNQNAHATWAFDMDAGISAIAIRIEAPQHHAVLQPPVLRMDWQVPIDLIDPVAGQVPLVSIQEFEPDQHQTQVSYTEEDSHPAKFSVRLDPNASQPQVVYEQKVNVYMTVFYNGEPVPEGYVPGAQ